MEICEGLKKTISLAGLLVANATTAHGVLGLIPWPAMVLLSLFIRDFSVTTTDSGFVLGYWQKVQPHYKIGGMWVY